VSEHIGGRVQNLDEQPEPVHPDERISGLLESRDPGVIIPELIAVLPCLSSEREAALRGALASRGDRYTRLVPTARLMVAVERGIESDVEHEVECLTREFGGLNVYEAASYMQFVAETRDPIAGAARLRELVADGATVNTYAVTPLIKGLCSRGLAGKAWDLIRELESAELRPDAVLMDIIIQGFAIAGDPTLAFRIMCEELPARLIGIDGHHVAGVMRAYALQGDAKKCRRLMNYLDERDIPPTEHHVRWLLLSHAVADMDGFLELHDHVDVWSVLADPGHRSAIARGMARGAPAEDINVWLKCLRSKGIEDPAPEYIEFLKASRILHAGDSNRVHAILSNMPTDDVPATGEVLRCLLALAGEAVQKSLDSLSGPIIDLCMAQVRSLSYDEITPDVLSHALRLLKFGRQPYRLIELAIDYDIHRANFSVHGVGLLMEAYRSTAQSAQCVQALRLALEQTIDDSGKTYLYNVALSAYAQEGRTPMSALLIQEMVVNGVDVDRYSLAALGSAFESAGAFDDPTRMVSMPDATSWTLVVDLLTDAVNQFRGPVGRVGLLAKAVSLQIGDVDLQKLGPALERLRAAVEELGRTSDHFRTNAVASSPPGSDMEREELSAVVSDIAHELNQSIGRVGATAHTVRVAAGTGNVEATSAAASRLVSAAGELGQRLQDYRASIAAERVEATFGVEQVLSEVQEALSGEGLLEGVALSIQAAPDAVHGHRLQVTGNEFLFRRAIRALIINAVEAMREAETSDPRIVVQALYRPGDGSASGQGIVEFLVMDNGPGIPEDIRQRVFQQGFTTKPGRGLGLGLATVQSVVSALRGSIVLQDDVPGGAAFIIRLPASGEIDAPKT
jgi:pentatricopeptide repeat protein